MDSGFCPVIGGSDSIPFRSCLKWRSRTNKHHREEGLVSHNTNEVEVSLPVTLTARTYEYYLYKRALNVC